MAIHERLFDGEAHPSDDLLVRLLGHHTQAVRSILLLELVADAIELGEYVLRVEPQTRGHALTSRSNHRSRVES